MFDLIIAFLPYLFLGLIPLSILIFVMAKAYRRIAKENAIIERRKKMRLVK